MSTMSSGSQGFQSGAREGWNEVWEEAPSFSPMGSGDMASENQGVSLGDTTPNHWQSEHQKDFFPCKFEIKSTEYI